MSAQDPPRVSPLNENRVGLYVVAQPVIPGLISQLRPELESKTYQEAAPSVSDAAALLAIVLSGNDVYHDIVLPYMDEAYLTRFLEKNTWVQEELQRAWANQDYAKLLQYTFWYDLPEAGDDGWTKRGTVVNNQVQEEALRAAWKTEYTGVLHKLLYVNIQEAFQEAVQEGERIPFANYACLINGSGSGKSRMLRQLASLMFSISINFRRSDNVTRQQMRSYPLPDHAPRDHFLRSRSLSYREQEAFFWTWFLTLFQVLSKELNGAKIQQQDTYGDLASLWSVSFERSRRYIYETAVQGHRDSGTHINAKQRKALRLELRQALRDLIEQIDLLVKPSARASNLNCVKMVCSFDEADVLALAKVPNNGKEGNMFEALCTSLDAFRGLPIFFIFLSTNSNVALLAPPKRMSTSDAARNHFDSLVAPFTETAFDCSPNFPLRRTGHTLKKISTIEFMAQFGRPLWQSMLQGTNEVLGVQKKGDTTRSNSQGKGKQEKVNPAATKELMDLARAKLIGCSDPLDWNEGSGDRDLSDRWSPLARRVLADNRISLGYEPAREKTYGELSTQVASHMRTAFSVPDHREYMRSGYPSEPILAEAAARELSLLKQSNPKKGPTTLPAIAAEALRHDLCSPGERGEVVGRILLTLAYDAAVERNHRVTEQSGPVNYSAGCPLIFFIEELFTSEHAMRILDSFPDNIPIIKKPDGNGNDSDSDNDDNDNGGDDNADVHPAKKTFREVFAKAYVHFTHFGRLGDDGGITSLALFAAYLRGQAQMGHPTQSQIDVAIPVVVDIHDICEKNMTVLLVSFKRRLVEGSRAQYNICADSLNVFIYSQGHAFTRRPYIALVMELGVCGRARYVLGPRIVVKPSKGQEEKTLVFQHPAIPSASTPQSPAKVTLGRQKQIQRELHDRKTKKKKKPLHPRYNIYAYGCSERVYKVIERSERPIYQILLANRDLFDEYPRKHVEGSLRGMLRQKPIWYTMIDSYHWIALNDWIVKAMQIEQAIAKKDFIPDDVFAGTDEDILRAVEQQAAASDDILNANDQDRQAEESPDPQAPSTSPDAPEAHPSSELDEDFLEKYDVAFPDDAEDAEGKEDEEEGNEERENQRRGPEYLHESTDQGVHDWSTRRLKIIGQGDEHPIKSKARHFEMDPFKVEDERVRREVREEENVQDELYLGEILLKSPAESSDDKPSQEESPSREAKKRMDSKKTPKDKRKGDHEEEELPERKKPESDNEGMHGGEGSRSRTRSKDKGKSRDDEGMRHMTRQK